MKKNKSYKVLLSFYLASHFLTGNEAFAVEDCASLMGKYQLSSCEEAQLRHGFHMQIDGKIDAARAEYLAVLETNPESYRAVSALGVLDLNLFSPGLNLASTLLSAESRFKHALELAEAAGDFAYVQRIKIEMARVILFKGVDGLLDVQIALSSAEAMLNEVHIEIDANSYQIDSIVLSNSYSTLAVIYQLTDRPKEAIRAYREALKLNDENADFILGTISELEGLSK